MFTDRIYWIAAAGSQFEKVAASDVNAESVACKFFANLSIEDAPRPDLAPTDPEDPEFIRKMEDAFGIPAGYQDAIEAAQDSLDAELRTLARKVLTIRDAKERPPLPPELEQYIDAVLLTIGRAAFEWLLEDEEETENDPIG